MPQMIAEDLDQRYDELIDAIASATSVKEVGRLQAELDDVIDQLGEVAAPDGPAEDEAVAVPERVL